MEIPHDTRIRTVEELEARRVEMFALADILERERIPFFICFGVLLGAVREKGFIPWDWDVELFVYTKDVLPQAEKLMELFRDAGFEIIRADLSPDNFKIDVFKKGTDPVVNSYTVVGWYKEDDVWKRRTLRIPARFFDSLDEIEFLGRTFKCPHDPVGYLEYQYGKDWRTPKRSSDPEQYWTREAFAIERALGNAGNGFEAAFRALKGVIRRALKRAGLR